MASVTGSSLPAFGKYQLLASLGVGGMSRVYLALLAGPAGFNKLFVLKVLRQEVEAEDPAIAQMFLEEARIAARLSHNNLVQTYEVGEVGGFLYIAMEHLEGQTLRALQRRLAPESLAVSHSLRILADVAKGLHHAHELCGFDGVPLGVVHRDVSPQNVFVTYSGQVKLLDFGIAKSTSGRQRTQAGIIKGKLDYIAPEQILGDHTDRRADVFSLGVMLWEALTGARFAGGPEVRDAEKMRIRVTGSERRLRHVNPDAPEAVARICEQAISIDPDYRHRSSLELALELEAFLFDHGLYPAAEDLGALVSSRFDLERSRLRSSVDGQLHRALSSTMSRSISLDELPELQHRQTLTALSTSMLLPLDIAPPSLRQLPALPSRSVSMALPQATPTGFPTVSRAMSLPPPEVAAQATVRPAMAAAPARYQGVLVAVAAALTVAAIAVVALRTGLLDRARDAITRVHTAPSPALRSPTDTSLAVAGTPAQPSSAPGFAQPSATFARPPTDFAPRPQLAPINLEIRVQPAHALVRLDDSALPTNPFVAQVSNDGRLHKLEVSADGYRTVERWLTYEREQTLDIALASLRLAGRYAGARRPLVAPAASSPAPAGVSTPLAVAPPSQLAPSDVATDAASVEPGADLLELGPRPRPSLRRKRLTIDEPAW